jgi:hypothetical protein
VALGAHLALLAWMHRAPAERPTPSTDGRTMELDVEPLEPPSSESAPPVLDEPRPERAPSTLAKRDERRTSAAYGDGRGTQEPVEAQPQVPRSGSDGAWTFSPTTTTTTDTPGGGPLAGHALNDAVRSGVRATVAESQRSDIARSRLLPAYNAHDVELGLAPGSALATLTQELVRRSRVPTEGHALLRLDSDALGIVASVHILEASAGHAEWNELAGQIATESRTKPLKVPPGARGVSVTIAVNSAMRRVDGGTPSKTALGKIVGAVTDPLDTAVALAAHEPLVHVVKARVVDVQAF